MWYRVTRKGSSLALWRGGTFSGTQMTKGAKYIGEEYFRQRERRWQSLYTEGQTWRVCVCGWCGMNKGLEQQEWAGNLSFKALESSRGFRFSSWSVFREEVKWWYYLHWLAPATKDKSLGVQSGSGGSVRRPWGAQAIDIASGAWVGKVEMERNGQTGSGASRRFAGGLALGLWGEWWDGEDNE